MNHAHVLTRNRAPSPAASTGRHNSVNPALTPNRARRPVDNDEYAASPAASCAPTPAG